MLDILAQRLAAGARLCNMLSCFNLFDAHAVHQASADDVDGFEQLPGAGLHDHPALNASQSRLLPDLFELRVDGNIDQDSFLPYHPTPFSVSVIPLFPVQSQVPNSFGFEHFFRAAVEETEKLW